MYAVIETGGKQYRVEVGTELEVELLDVEPGKTVTFRYRVVVHTGDAKGAKLDEKFRDFAAEVVSAD